MLLNIIIGEYSMDLEVPEEFISGRASALDRLDAEMDGGIQLGREWIDHPGIHERCQAAADRLLDAIETNNHSLALLTGGYILSRKPGVAGVRIDTNGEPGESQFF